ncbi:hypothetical protein [Corynebacterium aquatimens]|uniref:Uncharacterized protein n=1 Tax=Corynebacterium aquatimens TaxID=1190508 RepID=A0A931E2R6_9CORY|nr:hypothetical protein [Corynebacterium aquatimens]MBG6123173.1 hypothetical protein [Corynebacterium aquatimens]WJY66496.1 hypothetical protein CAQUA_09045 [Corynebacterium aquatimens]
MSTPLRRTKNDLIATAVIAAVCCVALVWAFFSAPIRQAHLETAAEEVPDQGVLAVVPSALTESWRVADESPRQRPLVVNGLIVAYSDNTITAYKADQTKVWSYTRKDAELCGLESAWNKVVAIYRTSVGCGDVVAINAATGQYDRTRSSSAPDDVVSFASNDRVGIVGQTRAELWRDDMVRTVEYGRVEAPQEPNMQPNPDCELTSAMTRSDLFAVTEKCEDGSYLRLQKTTPEDSRKPELHSSVLIPDGSYLVAVGQELAAIYDPAESTVAAYRQDGSSTAKAEVPPSNLLSNAAFGVARVETSDLPENMTYHDGTNLMLLDPNNLQVTLIFKDTPLGTGVAVADRLLFATPGNITVANWKTKQAETNIPVDRGGYNGPVSVASAGPTIVEKRGLELVILDATV